MNVLECSLNLKPTTQSIPSLPIHDLLKMLHEQEASASSSTHMQANEVYQAYNHAKHKHTRFCTIFQRREAKAITLIKRVITMEA